jgi:hypothetical protein
MVLVDIGRLVDMARMVDIAFPAIRSVVCMGVGVGADGG